MLMLWVVQIGRIWHWGFLAHRFWRSCDWSDTAVFQSTHWGYTDFRKTAYEHRYGEIFTDTRSIHPLSAKSCELPLSDSANEGCYLCVFICSSL